jgi:hypothetical protein
MYENEMAEPAPRRGGLLRKSAIIGVAAVLVGGMFMIGNGVASADDADNKPQDETSLDLRTLPSADPTEKPDEENKENEDEGEDNNLLSDPDLTANAEFIDLSIRVKNSGNYAAKVRLFKGTHSDDLGKDAAIGEIESIYTGQTKTMEEGISAEQDYTVWFQAALGKELSYNIGPSVPANLCFEMSGTTVIGFDVARQDCETGERI